MATEQDLQKIVDEMFAAMAATPVALMNEAELTKMLNLIDTANKLKAELFIKHIDKSFEEAAR